MKLIQNVNLIDDKKLLLLLNIVSIPLLIVFSVLFGFISSKFPPVNILQQEKLYGYSIIMFIVVYFAIIVIHEMIHGLFFKLLNKKAKVKFGFKNGCAYATSPNTFYSKSKFLVILLAPFVFITFALFLFYWGGFIHAVTFVILAASHAAACVGDFYFVYLILRAPQNSQVEDTEQGIAFYTTTILE
jgi:hypothetical protein